MFSLIVVVVAIGLMAAIIATTINHVPLDAQLRQQMFKEADRGLKTIECAVTRYLDAHRDEAGNIVALPPGDLVAKIAPEFGFMPAAVRKELTWEVASGTLPGTGKDGAPGEAVAICLRPIGTPNAMQREVLAKLQEQAPKGSTFVADTCNATQDGANGAYLTLWVPVSHVN